MPVRALVAAAALFSMGSNRVRVALARLVAEGWVIPDGRGHYRLGQRSQTIRAQVRNWRRFGGLVRAWDGGWAGVHTAALAPGRSRARRRHEQALRLLGFRTLARGLEVRPDNLVGGIAAVRDPLDALGLDPACVVFRIDALAEQTEVRARALWDVDALRAAYRRSRQELADSERRLARLGPKHAMVETFLLGGRVLRQLALDPLLPDEICPRAERDELVDAMRRYDRSGRACWSELLRRFGVPHLRAPVDLRVDDATRLPVQTEHFAAWTARAGGTT